MVFMAVDERRVQYSGLTANDAVVAVRINYLAAFENILQVLPDTKDVIVVVGTSPIEKFWKEAIAKGGWNLLQTGLSFHGPTICHLRSC